MERKNQEHTEEVPRKVVRLNRQQKHNRKSRLAAWGNVRSRNVGQKEGVVLRKRGTGAQAVPFAHKNQRLFAGGEEQLRG